MTKILLLRHAQSIWNSREHEKVSSKYGSILPLTGNLQIESAFKEYFLSVINPPDPDILNSKLSPHGISQCKNAAPLMHTKYPKVKRALISPMKRCIQTFEEIFEQHPNFSNIKVTIFPGIKETLNTPCDVAFWDDGEFEGLRHKEKYDFSV